MSHIKFCYSFGAVHSSSPLGVPEDPLSPDPEPPELPESLVEPEDPVDSELPPEEDPDPEVEVDSPPEPEGVDEEFEELPEVFDPDPDEPFEPAYDPPP